MTVHSETGDSEEGTVPRYDLVVSLGTDYHTFDRLVDWVDAYLAKHSEVSCLFQHGFTHAPENATDSISRLPRADLMKIYEQAKVVVVQGGPGSILDAREVGQIPFAVPRRSDLDEVVDDHQIEFSRVMESYGETRVITDAEDFESKVNWALDHPEQVRGEVRLPGADLAADKMSELFANFVPSVGHDSRKFVRRCGQVLRGIVVG